jgi:hypothetical protein
MKPKTSMVFLATVLLVVLAGCAPNSVVQVGTPVATTQPGTPAPSGQIEVPGVSINLYAPGPNPLLNTPDAHGSPAGFWLGIWHGVISPVTLVASFVTRENVQTYEVHNDGSLYNLGFFIGILVIPTILGLLFGRRG